MKLNNKILTLVIYSIFIGALTFPLLVAASPPPIVDHYATSYFIHPENGPVPYSGTLADTRTNNEQYLVAKAGWFWFIGCCFDVYIDFDFQNSYYDSIIVDIADNAPGYNMLIVVHYTSGDPDVFPEDAGSWDDGWLSDGQYTFTLDSRIVDHVQIIFHYVNLVLTTLATR